MAIRQVSISSFQVSTFSLSLHQLLKSPQVHLTLIHIATLDLLQHRQNRRIERLPIRISQMILLRVLVLVALDDCEVTWVVDGLHHEPGEGFFVLRVDG